MTLRVSRLDGRVTLTLPKGVAKAEAIGFAHERADWIRGHLENSTDSHVIGLGSEIPILGEMRCIVPGQGRRVELTETEIRVPVAENRVAARLQAWLKQLARSELAYASDRYSELLGRPYTKLTLRDTRSRWGSCTSAGGLMYSWRLIMAPADVLTYVAAHEIAHLAEMNHSQAFWDIVGELYGDYRAPRAWLRTEGHRLHAFRFGA